MEVGSEIRHDISMLSGGVSMKCGTIIHYISGHCCKGFQGQRSTSNCITVKWKFEAHDQQHLVTYVTGTSSILWRMWQGPAASCDVCDRDQQHLVMYVTGVKWMMNWKLNNLLTCISMCGVKAHLLHVAVIVLNFGLFLKNCPPCVDGNSREGVLHVFIFFSGRYIHLYTHIFQGSWQ